MKQELHFQKIATIETDFPEKFGIPRQSGLADTTGRIIFEKEYRNPDALRQIEQYSHLWLIWHFSENVREEFVPTVRPPRLGGNQRVGVFATRSPFRPNPIGLSCVEFCKVEMDESLGPILYVSGVDLMNGTPILDIKPYLPYVDSHPQAKGGFSDEKKGYALEVEISAEQERYLTAEKFRALRQILSQDPRPSYQNDPQRIYGMVFAGHEIKFRVERERVIVVEIYPV